MRNADETADDLIEIMHEAADEIGQLRTCISQVMTICSGISQDFGAVRVQVFDVLGSKVFRRAMVEPVLAREGDPA